MRPSDRTATQSNLSVRRIYPAQPLEDVWAEHDDPELVRRTFEEIDAGEVDMEAERAERVNRLRDLARSAVDESGDSLRVTNGTAVASQGTGDRRSSLQVNASSSRGTASPQVSTSQARSSQIGLTGARDRALETSGQGGRMTSFESSSSRATSQLTVTATFVSSGLGTDIVAGANALSIRDPSPPPAYSPPTHARPDISNNGSSTSHLRNPSTNSHPSNESVQLLSSTIRGADNPAGGQSSSGNGTVLSVESLPFYHSRPIVPMTPGTEPLPVFSRTTFPLLPDEQADTNQNVGWYFTSVAINPGLHRGTWEEFRANVEAHRGLPWPHSPSWQRVRSPLPETLARIRILPPPPRPAVRVDGQHHWVVYVGRLPGIYSTLQEVREQTDGIRGAQAEIFSSREAAIRWYWYARAQGFLESRRA